MQKLVFNMFSIFPAMALLGGIISCKDTRTGQGEDWVIEDTKPIKLDINQELKDKTWHLFGKHGINIEPAWTITTGSRNVRIGIIDSDFHPQNPVFNKGQCYAKYELYEPLAGEKGGSHGTEVASTISSCVNNPKNIVAINYRSPHLWVDRGPSITVGNPFFNWIVGNDFVCKDKRNYPVIPCERANKKIPDIINMSYGESGPSIAGYSESQLLPIIKQFNTGGGILVASSGNESQNGDYIFPAGATGVISAGATAMTGKASGFSNWGETVEVMAPGQDIRVGFRGDFIKSVSGTSFAAPITSGVVSLMKSVYPKLNWKTAIYLMQSTAKPMSCESYCSDAYARYQEVGADDTMQDRCMNDCCHKGVQICTPGLIDAGAAVKAAKNAARRGVVKASLIDAESYVEKLQKIGFKYVVEFTVYNVGDKRGVYNISVQKYKRIPKYDIEVQFDKQVVDLAPKGHPGDRATIRAVANTNKIFRIRLGTEESGKVSGFSDEIVLTVLQILPGLW